MFFSSKCSFFHSSNVFGSCIINILYTGYAKIKKKIPTPKKLKRSANTKVFHISLFIKRVYRALPPLLECSWPHFKRQLTVSHSFWYHGHLGRPHTGEAPAKIAISNPLCQCTNWEHTFIGTDIAELQNKNKKNAALLEFPFISDNDNIHYTWPNTCQLVCARASPPHCSPPTHTAPSAYAFAFVVCAHAQYRARNVALLPGHK